MGVVLPVQMNKVTGAAVVLLRQKGEWRNTKPESTKMRWSEPKTPDDMQMITLLSLNSSWCRKAASEKIPVSLLW